jgi:mRNA interferase RelE/StbE
LKKYSITYTKEAKKKIEKLDPSIKSIIKKAIESLSTNPFKGKPLSYELAGLYSLRTSDYRIIYRIKEKQLIILVISVGHRKEIYKRLKELITRD